jgi:hypothetical protein
MPLQKTHTAPLPATGTTAIEKATNLWMATGLIPERPFDSNSQIFLFQIGSWTFPPDMWPRMQF